MSDSASSPCLGKQVGGGELDSFNLCGGVDRHLEHLTAFHRVKEIGIGLRQRSFEHGVSIPWWEMDDAVI